MAQQLDEFGIPIKSQQNTSEVDEFGIPIKKNETADLKSEGSLNQSPVSNGQSKSASPSSETSSAEKRVVNPENKPIMTTFAPKPAGKVWENPFANSFQYKKEKPDTKNPLGKGTVVEQPKEKSTKKKDENPYAVDITVKSDNAKTQIKEKAQIQQDIQTGELEKRNPTSYIGASTLYAEKAAEITGKSDTKGLLEYSKTIGVDDDLTDRLPDFDKKILANNQKLKDLYAQLEIAQKSGNEQNIKDAQKRISEVEKANSSLLVIRNKDIDTQILAIQKQLDSGTKKVENYLESAPSGNMYGTMSTTPQVKYVPLTEQEKAQMKSQIKSLEKRKGAYLQDVTDEQAVFTDLKPKIKLYEDKNIIPKDANSLDKLRIYYGIKLTQLRKLKERSESENGSPLLQDNPILSGLGISTKEFGKEVIKSVKQRVFDDKTTKEIMEIEGELDAIAPVVALNLDPNIKSSGFWKTFGSKTLDAITQTTKTGNTKQETAAYIQKAAQDAGVTLTNDRKSEIATQLQNEDIGQRSEKIGQGLGSTVGFAVDFAATMPLSGAIIGKAAKLAQVLSPKTRAGIGIIESALNETRLGRLAVNMTDEGLKYSVSGKLNEVIKDDATLSQGALGAAGSKLGEKTIQPIASLFGKNAGKFISLMGDTFGRSIVELSEEVSQNTGALVNEVSGKDSFIKGVIELFNDSEKGAQFTKSLKEQYGDMDESVDFAIQIFAMSTAFNVGKFGKFFKELAFKKRDTLSETGKEKFDAVVNDLESEVVQATQKAADDMKQNEGITVEDIVTDMDKAERESLEDVGDAEYKAFIDSGTVAPERLNSIAEKVKAGTQLSEKEYAIFTDKTAEINDIIKTGVAPESATAQAATPPQENQTTETAPNVGDWSKDVESTAKALEDKKTSLDEKAKKLGYIGIKQFNAQNQLREDLNAEEKELLKEYSDFQQEVKNLKDESVISKLNDDEFSSWSKANDITRDDLGKVVKDEELELAAKRIRILNARGDVNKAESELKKLRESKKKDNWTVESWKERFDEDISQLEIDEINESNKAFNEELDKQLVKAVEGLLGKPTENQTTENTDGKENATTPTESTDTGQEQNVSTGFQQSDSNNGEVQQGDGTAAKTGQQPEVEQQQAEPQQKVEPQPESEDKKQKAASLIQQLGLPKKKKAAEVKPEPTPAQQPMSAESTDTQDVSKKEEEIDKGKSTWQQEQDAIDSDAALTLMQKQEKKVEVTAKALEVVDLPSNFVAQDKGGILNRENYYRLAQEKFQESEGLTNEEIFDKNKQIDEFKTQKGRDAFQKRFEQFAENTKTKKQILAEAYHKSKANDSNPQLVEAVEKLLGKPTEKAEEGTNNADVGTLTTTDKNFNKEEFVRDINKFEKQKANGSKNIGLYAFKDKFIKLVKSKRKLSKENLSVLRDRVSDMDNVFPAKEIIDLPDGSQAIVMDKASGKIGNELTESEIDAIPQSHWDKFEQTIRELSKRGIQTDLTKRSNVLYDKDKGFQFIDLEGASIEGDATVKFFNKDGKEFYYDFEKYPFFPRLYKSAKEIFTNIGLPGETNAKGELVTKNANPTPTNAVNQPVQQDAATAEQQGNQAAVQQSPDATGQGNAEAAVADVEQKPTPKAETPAQDSQENIKLAQDGNEQQLAEQKLTEQDNIEQEPNIKIIEGKAESDSKVELAEAIKQADELINIATEVVVLPISEIKTNTLVYQGRKREYSERSANNVANTFDKNKFDPIVVYRHPDGNTYVLSGHSRLEGMKRRGATEIPTRVFEGTPEAARIFALNSNKLGTLQTELENAEYYREKLKKGESYNSVLTEAKENEQPGSAKRVVDIAHLNPEGKAILALEAMEEAEGDNKSRITQIAQKIGALRSKFDFLTDAHENELFDYFMDNKDVPSDRDINDPKNQISRSIGAVKYDTSQPLNLKSIKVKSDVRVEWEQKRDELTQQIADIKKEVNPSKKTGWTGLKEKLIASIAKGKSEEAINQAEADFNNNKNGVKDVYLKLLDRKRDELRAVSDKLAKHLLQEKNLIEGEKNQQVLFLISGEKGVSAQTQEADIRLKDLEVAREMEAEGKMPLDIKIATGWERGADGLWNYEVMDGELKNLKGLKGENKLSDVLDNDQLFEMYPEMKDAIVVVAPLSDASGSFSKEYDMDSGKEVMVFKVDESLVGDKAKFKSILLHEIQHGIQDIEGFAKGGNTEQFNDTTLVSEWWNDEGGANEDIPFDELTPKQQQDAEQRYMDEVGDSDAFYEYKKLAGEVQARNVEKRKDMTPEQRRNTLLETTEDVSRKDQTFLRDNASDMQSVSASSNFQTITKSAFDNLMEKLKKAFPSVKVFSDEKTLKEKLKQYGVDVAQFMTIAWHGSPYSFDKFTTDKIGTGEGAQAFGWGLYFTDLESIARDYADKLSEHSIYINGQEISDLRGTPLYDVSLFIFGSNNISKEQGKDSAIANLKQAVRDNRIDYDEAQKAIKYLDGLESFSVKKDKRNLYKVSLHKGKTPDQYTWLEWDKPVSDDILKKIGFELEIIEDKKVKGFDFGLKINGEIVFRGDKKDVQEQKDRSSIGRLIYKELSKKIGGDKEASLFLLENGIDGIKYPAESIARGVTSDTARGFNYVVFDEKAVEIEEKVQFLRTQSGTIYGAKFPDGTIYINTDNLNANTPIHEYGHIWQSVFPMEFKKGIELLKLSPQGRALIKKTAENPAYKGKPIEDIEAEALVTAIGNKGETIFNSNPSFFKKFKEWMSDFFKTIGDKLGIRDLSADEKLDRFTKKVVGDLLGEKVLSEAIDGISGTDLQSIEDSKLKSLVDIFKDNGFTYDEMIEALEENEVDYDEAQVKDAWGAGVPPVNTDTEVVTTDGKTRKKALLYKAYNGESNPDMKAAIEQHDLDYIVESQDAVIKAVNDTMEANGGIEAAFAQVRKLPNKGAAAAVIYDAKLRKIQDEMATAEGAKYDELVTEMALIYKEMDEIAREAGRFSSMLHKIYQTSDLAYAYARQKELYEKATGKPIPADIELKFKELADTIKKADSRIAELEKEKKEIEDKYRDTKTKEEVDILIEEAYKKGKAEGSFGKETVQQKKRMERAKAKIAEGLEDVMKGLGLIQMAEGTNRPSMVKGFVKMGQGLIDAGIATAENVYDKIKEEIEKAAKKSVDISSFKDDIEKAFNEPKKLKVPNSRVRELIQNGANTIEEVVDGLKEEYPDKTDREIRDGVSGYGDVKPTNDDPIEAKLRRMKRIGRYMSALEDLNANKRPSRSGQQRDELDPEERAMLKEIREKLKNLPLDDADLSKKLKTAQDAIEARTRNAIEDIQRQIDMIQSGMKPGEVLTRNTKTPITDKIQELKDELKAKKEELRMLREASKLEDTIQELKDMAAITGERNIPKKAVEDGLIQDLVQAHIEKGTPLDEVQEQVFTQLKGIFPEATDSDIRNAILRQGKFKREAKEISELRKKENELAKQLRLKEEIEKLEKGIVSISKQRGADSAEVQDLRQRLKAKKEEAINTNVNVSIKDLERQIANVKRSKSEVLLKLAAKEFEKKVKMKKQFTNDPAWKAKHAELRKEKLERIKAKHDFDKAQEKARMAQRSFPQKVRDVFWDFIGIPKSAVATIDLSAPLRQGIGLGLTNPKEFGRAFVNMHKFLKKANFDEFMDNIRERDDFYVISQSGLAITDPSGKASAREDTFMNNLVKKIPVYNVFYNASERAYSGFLNMLRVEVYSKGVEQLEAQGLTFEENPEQFKALARVINNATGRGELGFAEPIAKELGVIFFSPRMFTSRVGMFTDMVRPDTSWVVRKKAIQNVAALTAYNATVVALGTYAVQAIKDDDDDDLLKETLRELEKQALNPIHTDFLKVKYGNTRYDMSAGFSNLIRLIFRLYEGKAISGSGKETDLSKKGYKTDTRLTEVGKFTKNKLSPSGKFVYSALANEDVDDPRNSFDLGRALWSLVIPLSVRDAAAGENFEWEIDEHDREGVPFINVSTKKSGDWEKNREKYFFDRILSTYGGGIQQY